MNSQRKITILGAGHVGSHCAMALAAGAVCEEIVLVDALPEKAAAQALDVADALSFPPRPVTVRAGTLADCADADLLVVAIGKPRLPGQTRLDLLADSVRSLQELTAQLRPMGVKGLVISITNPADIVADYLRRGLGLPRSRVFGTGTQLDTARLIRILSEESGLARSSISAFSMGEHGDSSMVPFSQVRLGGLPFEAYPNLSRERILERTRRAGMDVIEAKGSTEFGISQALASLCGSILADEKRVLPLSVELQGEYGQTGVHCGVPCRVGRQGIEEIVVLPLTAQEQQQLDASCQVIRSHIESGLEIAPLP